MEITIVDIFTLLFSGFALYISLITFAKQSKITLFEKRYDVYYQLQKIIKFKNDIKNITIKNDKEDSIVVEYFKTWCAQNVEFINMISSIDENSQDIVYRHFSMIESRKEEELKALDKICLLFYLNEDEKAIVESLYYIYEKMIEVMVDISYKKGTALDIVSINRQFVEATEVLENKLITKLKDVISINNIKLL